MKLSSGNLQFWEWKNSLFVPENFVHRPCWYFTFLKCKGKNVPLPWPFGPAPSGQGGIILHEVLLQCGSLLEEQENIEPHNSRPIHCMQKLFLPAIKPFYLYFYCLFHNLYFCHHIPMFLLCKNKQSFNCTCITINAGHCYLCACQQFSALATVRFASILSFLLLSSQTPWFQITKPSFIPYKLNPSTN